MKVSQIIGVDVSKKTLDFYLLPAHKHVKLSNCPTGFAAFIKWLVGMGVDLQDVLLVMEHTGHYSYRFEQYLHAQQLAFAKVSGLAIKRSMGMTRGKSDKQDAALIARYGIEKMSRLVVCQPVDKSLEQLQMLHSTRAKLVAIRAGLLTAVKELQFMCGLKSTDPVISSQVSVVNCLTSKIAKLNQEILLCIQGDESIKNNLQLLQSIKGIGKVVALAFIIKTGNFTKFRDGRKFACYCGTAPFENSSGSSIRGKTRVSHLADKPMKTLLSLSAFSAVKSDPELIDYYRQRQARGKSKMSTINVVRNKIIHRAFAVINRQTPYQPLPKAA